MKDFGYGSYQKTMLNKSSSTDVPEVDICIEDFCAISESLPPELRYESKSCNAKIQLESDTSNIHSKFPKKNEKIFNLKRKVISKSKL